MNQTNVNELWEKFHNILNGAVKLFPFVRDVYKKSKLKWWYCQIEAGLLHKEHTHNKYLSQNEKDTIEYERLGREVKKTSKYILQINQNPILNNFTPT